MKILIIAILALSCSTSNKKPQVQDVQKNPVDQIECDWADEAEKNKVCNGEKPPVSERLDSSLKKDAKKIKSFFGL